MRRFLIPAILVTCLIFSSPVFTSAASDYEWVLTTGDRYDYSWTVEDSTKTVVFQENFYIIIDDLAFIPQDVTPSAVWTLSENGFNVSTFWSNGTAFDVSTVPQPFEFNLLPVGNWSQLIDAFPIEAGFLNGETIFAYEYFDLFPGDGEHKEVKFQKSNGVLELYHMHQYADNIAVFRLDIELISSTPVTGTTTPTDTTTTTLPPSTTPTTFVPDSTMYLVIVAAGGGVVVLIGAMIVIKRRV
ncbi:MAG: hypothetical protein ACXAAO_02810 [Candidatus Thorarchaeota archaeon]|jgi:hypothetical protein